MNTLRVITAKAGIHNHDGYVQLANAAAYGFPTELWMTPGGGQLAGLFLVVSE